MNRGTFLLAVIVASTMAAGAWAQILPPPPSWSLGQNDPDPFCDATRIEFGIAQDAHVQLSVWNAEQSAVVRLLVDQMLPAGLHAIVWDGRDDQGARPPNGEYAYRIVAQVDGATVYDSSLMLHVLCNVAAEQGTWGALKDLYGP